MSDGEAIKMDRITVEVEIMVPHSEGPPTIADGMPFEDMVEAIRAVDGRAGPVTILSHLAPESYRAPAVWDGTGIAEAPSKNGLQVLCVVRPTEVRVPAEYYETVPLTVVVETEGGWRASWRLVGGGIAESPHLHATKNDALTDARRREAAQHDPEAEADEFEDGSHQDPFDATIHYGCLFIDDEDQWRGRWYRDEWTSEGAYTDALYDTQGQARRAARRLRTTGDES